MGNYITRGLICEYLDSPSGFKLRHIEGSEFAQRPESSKSMDLGNYFETILLEGEDAFQEKFPLPEFAEIPSDWKTPSGNISTSKSVKAEIAQAVDEGVVFDGIKESLSKWDFRLKPHQKRRIPALERKARFMVDRMKSQKFAMDIINGCPERQKVIRATLRNGLKVQVKPDFMGPTIMGDLKTSKCRKEEFMKDAVKHGYHIQEWFYSALARVAGFAKKYPFQFVIQMNDYPWDAYVLAIPDEVKEWAGFKVKKALEGMSHGNWGQPQTNSYVPFVQYWLANEIDSDLSEDI